MSHAEYVAGCDEGQLESLIEHANGRLKTIRESGHVKLWEVSIGWGNVAWFAENDYDSAVQCAIESVLSRVKSDKTKGLEMEIKLERYRPDEAAELVTRWPKSRKNKLSFSPEDNVRLMFAMSDIDGFAGVKRDKYEFAMQVATENGRSEASENDELLGVRRLIDAAIKVSSSA